MKRKIKWSYLKDTVINWENKTDESEFWQKLMLILTCQVHWSVFTDYDMIY